MFYEKGTIFHDDINNIIRSRKLILLILDSACRALLFSASLCTRGWDMVPQKPSIPTSLIDAAHKFQNEISNRNITTKFIKGQ